MYSITETNDYTGLAEMFSRNGLEISPEEWPPEGMIKCWEVIDDDTSERVAGVELEKKSGEYVVGGISVEAPYRRQDLATLMMRKLIDEVKLSGGSRIMLVARVPDFFKSLGFVCIDRKTAPNISNCMTCRQFDIECFPEVMQLDME